jgi:hypothetical protein
MVMERETIAEVETQITYDMFKEFYRFSLFKGRYYKITPWYFLIIVSIGALMALYSGLTYGFERGDTLTLVFLTTLSVVMAILFFYMPKKGYDTAKVHFSAPNIYRFTEDALYAESMSELSKGTSEIRYEAIHRIYEFKKVIYIFISNAQAFPIDKSNFDPEGLKRVREILKGKLGKKYKSYVKR